MSRDVLRQLARAIAIVSRMHRTRTVVASAFAFFALNDATFAQVDARPRVIVVTCTDADGKPVAGAEVHVFQSLPQPEGRSRMQGAGPFTTDDDGRVRTAVALTHSGGRYDRWVYAVLPGKLVGGVRRVAGQEGDPDAIAVRLLPSRTVKGRVTVPTGFDPTTVRVRTLSLSRIDGDNLFGAVFPRQTTMLGFHDPLPDRFDCAVQADGTFALGDLPETPLLCLAAAGEGLAQAQFSNGLLPERKLPDLIELALEPESVLAGTVRGPDGTPCIGATVRARIAPGSGAMVLAAFESKTDAAGAFRVRGLPAATFDIAIESPAGVFRPQQLELGMGQRLMDFAAALETPVEVTGIVVASDDGKPIEGVPVMAITDMTMQTRLDGNVTGPTGRFVLRLPRGVASLYLGGVPPQFAYPDPQILATLDVGRKDGRLLRFELARKGK